MEKIYIFSLSTDEIVIIDPFFKLLKILHIKGEKRVTYEIIVDDNIKNIEILLSNTIVLYQNDMMVKRNLFTGEILESLPIPGIIMCDRSLTYRFPKFFIVILDPIQIIHYVSKTGNCSSINIKEYTSHPILGIKSLIKLSDTKFILNLYAINFKGTNFIIIGNYDEEQINFEVYNFEMSILSSNYGADGLFLAGSKDGKEYIALFNPDNMKILKRIYS